MLKQIVTSLAITCVSLSCIAKPVKIDSKKEVLATLTKVADWQIENAWDEAAYKRYHKSDNDPKAWTFGALYVGMELWAEASGDEKYFDWLKGIGENQNWGLLGGSYFADHHAVGHFYLELYRKYKKKEMKKAIQERLDWIIENPSKQGLDIDNYKNTQRWTWCDALFMSPPVLAKLSSITGDTKYKDFMIKEYKATTVELFDKEESLYFRDHSFIDKRDEGKKVFWSRGNGWVFASLPLIISELEKGSEDYQYFVSLFQTMAPALKKLQTKDGHWAMSLLKADKYPTPETSGTAFFTYGFAWGINTGLLEEDEYALTVKKGWKSLKSHVNEEGKLGYVQAVGAAPGKAFEDYSEVYGVGAFLAAGSEILKLVD